MEKERELFERLREFTVPELCDGAGVFSAMAVSYTHLQVVRQIHHGEGQGEGLAFLAAGHLQKEADQLFADGALGEDLHPLCLLYTSRDQGALL